MNLILFCPTLFHRAIDVEKQCRHEQDVDYVFYAK